MEVPTNAWCPQYLLKQWWRMEKYERNTHACEGKGTCSQSPHLSSWRDDPVSRLQTTYVAKSSSRLTFFFATTKTQSTIHSEVVCFCLSKLQPLTIGGLKWKLISLQWVGKVLPSMVKLLKLASTTFTRYQNFLQTNRNCNPWIYYVANQITHSLYFYCSGSAQS